MDKNDNSKSVPCQEVEAQREYSGSHDNVANVPDIEFVDVPEDVAESNSSVANDTEETSNRDNVTVNDETVPLNVENRVSSRSNKEKPPARLIEEANSAKHSISEPKDVSEILSRPDKELWLNAMQEEIDSLNKNNTWELTDAPTDRKPIGCKWVFKLKQDHEGNIIRHKARLVAQGFSQKFGQDYDEIFAPVAKQTTIRILLSLIGKRKLFVRQYDAKTAFLNGKLNETIFMKQPSLFVEEGKEQMVCKLKRSLYGLKQSARCWNQTFHYVLSQLEYRQSANDPCLYTKQNPEGICYIVVYVDDIIITSNNLTMIQDAEEHLKTNFDIKVMEGFKQFLGIEISLNKAGHYEMNQAKYVNKLLADFNMKDSKTSNYPLNPSYGKSKDHLELLPNNQNYQKLIGCLLYLAVNTRPDIAASVIILSRKVSQPNTEDWNEAKRILRYLKGTANYKLKLSTSDDNLLIGYADASFAEDPDCRKSTSGYIFKVFGGVVSWSCRKQTCVALSSMEAEFVALSEACQEAVWMKKLLLDFNEQFVGPIIIFEDNQSCLNLIKEENLSKRSKHIDTKMFFVKDYIDKGIIKCTFCPTKTMLADMMTKPLSSVRLYEMCQLCGLEDHE